MSDSVAQPPLADRTLTISPEALCELAFNLYSEPLVISRWLVEEIVTQLDRVSSNPDCQSAGILINILQRAMRKEDFQELQQEYIKVANCEWVAESN